MYKTFENIAALGSDIGHTLAGLPDAQADAVRGDDGWPAYLKRIVEAAQALSSCELDNLNLYDDIDWYDVIDGIVVLFVEDAYRPFGEWKAAIVVLVAQLKLEMEKGR